MSVTFETLKSLDNNRILIKEQSQNAKSTPRLYIAPQDKADEFISQRKLIEKNHKFQKVATGVMSAVIGLLVGAVVKFGSFGKTVAGLATGAVALCSGLGIDKKVNDGLQNSALKNCHVEEVTGQKIEDIK